MHEGTLVLFDDYGEMIANFIALSINILLA